MESRKRGWLLWFDEKQNFGYIGADNGKKYFFHGGELLEGVDDGQRISFVPCRKASVNRRGGPHASQVRGIRKNRQ